MVGNAARCAMLGLLFAGGCRYPSPFDASPVDGDEGDGTDGSTQERSVCGDAVIQVGAETCDDGNTLSGDGCSASCAIEPGYGCATAGAPCTFAVCGNSVREGSEGCDDGNLHEFDGCSSTCVLETICPGGLCVATCGDGLLDPGEGCDDGNVSSGDGCSATCTGEPAGFSCANAAPQPAAVELVPIVVRDFIPSTQSGGHTDFENLLSGVATNLVRPTLGANSFPVFNQNIGTTGTQALSTAANFAQWWQDTTPARRVDISPLMLTPAGGETYQYNSSMFFPIDGRGYADVLLGHNFSFTTEVRTRFTYQGGEVVDFVGDDDVWIFVNGQLVLDLGGVHVATAATFNLTPAAVSLGLVVGQTAEIAIFQAERHTSQSNYKLTLTRLHRISTHCTSTCGDGIKTPAEQCDHGTDNTGGYGRCSASCTWTTRCGDGTLQSAEGEQCDDGNFVAGDGCSPTCKHE